MADNEDNKDTKDNKDNITKEAPNATRKEAIGKAIESTDESEKKESPAEKPDKPVEPAKPEQEKESKEVNQEEQELTEQGRQLILALRDPQKAGVVIKFLAEQHGYSKIETPKEVKEAKNEIVEDLKESLGTEFEFLADKLAPGIEKILKKQLAASQADIREQFKVQEAEKLRTQSASALENLSDSFFGKGEILPDEVAKEMSKYMDRVQPNPTSSVKEYVEDAFHSAIGKLGLVKTDKDKKERISRNRNDASSRLNGAPERVPSDDNIRGNPKPMSRQQAIQAAIDSVGKEN